MAKSTAPERPSLKIKKLHSDVKTPKYQTAGAACFDLHAFEPEWVIHRHVREREPLIVHTGLCVEVPEGYVMLIFSRGSQGFNGDVRLSNCTGVIDSDYRGEILVKLACDNAEVHHKVEDGDRIAQAMLVAVDQWEMEVVETLSGTVRGEGGFGSTGKQ